jgi:hypothetical protein
MRTIIAKASMALGAVCLCGVALYAQTYQVSAKIPFSFHVGDAVVPAGEYQLGATGNKPILQLRSRTTGRGNFVTIKTGAENTEHRRSVLVFNRYGDAYFLSEIWDESGIGSKVPTTKSEKEYMSRPNEVAAVTVYIPVRAD